MQKWWWKLSNLPNKFVSLNLYWTLLWNGWQWFVIFKDWVTRKKLGKHCTNPLTNTLLKNSFQLFDKSDSNISPFQSAIQDAQHFNLLYYLAICLNNECIHREICFSVHLVLMTFLNNYLVLVAWMLMCEGQEIKKKNSPSH